jgi:tetratricopeptide (TPR) repeat protein
MKKINLLIVVSVVFLQTLSSQAQTSVPARQLAKKGTTLMSQNKLDAAIESYTRAIELSPNYAEAYIQRGLAKRARGDLAGSIEDYEKAASIDPKSVAGNRFVAQAYSNRGLIKLNALDVDDAIEDFTKAININSNEDDHYYRRGYARLINEDLKEALEDLNKALTDVGKDNFSSKTLIYASRGMVKLLQGKSVEAQMDFDECVKSNKEERLDVREHLLYIEIQIRLRREQRATHRRIIA